MTDELEPGYEWCCQDCKSRITIVDENGKSYECYESDDCEQFAELEVSTDD